VSVCLSKRFIFLILFLGGGFFLFYPSFFSFGDQTQTSVQVESFPAPSNLTATVISSTQIDLSWSQVSGAVSYKVYRDSTYIASSTAESYSDTGLSSGTTYSYTVSAVNSLGGESSQSSSVSATTLSLGGGMVPQWHNPPKPPLGGFSVLINDGAVYTRDLKVRLTLGGGPDAERMVISNFSDFHDAGQELYTESKEWNLCKGLSICSEGEYRVYVKFYTSWGKSSEVVSDTIIFKKTKPIIEKIKEVPKKIKESVEKITEEVGKISKKISQLIKPKPPVAPYLPIEKPLPLVFQGKWQLLPYSRIYKFVLAPLPREFQILTQKFPTLKSLFTEVGISKIPHLQKLKSVKLTLPGLTERIGLKVPKGIPVGKLSPEIKKKIPTNIIFAKTGGGQIDFNILLTVTPKGKPQQRIRTISGQPLRLVIKPDKPVKKIKGYVVFRKKEPLSRTTFQFSLASLIDSFFFTKPVLAISRQGPLNIEEKLVLIEFEYTDPDGDGIYTAEIQAPKVEGEYEIITVMDYEDPTLGLKEIRLITVVDPEGYVFEKYQGKELRIANAVVSLYWQNQETQEYELWPAEEFLQKNPQVTDSTGKYSFLVPPGNYYLKVEAPGYLSYQSKIFKVEEGSGIHFNIELKVKYWWLRIFDWKAVLLILIILFLLYRIYRDKIKKEIKIPKRYE